MPRSSVHGSGECGEATRGDEDYERGGGRMIMEAGSTAVVWG